MKKNLVLILVLLGFFFNNGLRAQVSPQEKGLEVITIDAIKAQLEFLASDWTEGRETGKRGIYMAGDYVASMFKYSGVPGGGDIQRRMGRRMMRGEAPAEPERTYFQNFTLLETLPGGESSLSVRVDDMDYIFQEDVDYTVRASSTTSISGEVVFVGYGLVSEDLGINELSGADLRGKIAVRLAGLPGMGDENSPVGKKLMEDRMAAYSLMRGRDNMLEEMGVLAVIEVSPQTGMSGMPGEYMDDMNLSPNESSRNTEFTRLSLESQDISSGMITVNAGPRLMKAILKNSRIDLAEYEAEAANELGKYKPVAIAGTKIHISKEVNKRRVNVRNVIAMIEGKRKDEFVVIGAHMDHMGMSGGRVWNGADDNASGTVGVMTIARAFAATGVQPERTVLFCAWTGEEKGLLGSEYFTRNPTFSSMDKCKFYINFDMISRNSEREEDNLNVSLTYNSNYPEILDMCKKNVTEYGLKMNYQYRGQEAPRGGSDYTAFTENGVPVIAFMAAMHPDYHTPNDQVEFVNWEKMLDIIKLGFLNLWEVANAE